MAKVTWLGDEDPSVQMIQQNGFTFVKDVPTDVPAKDKSLDMFNGNAFFSVDEKADAVPAVEPDPVDPEQGTEIAALKAELDAKGVVYRANASLDSLRKLLADSVAV